MTSTTPAAHDRCGCLCMPDEPTYHSPSTILCRHARLAKKVSQGSCVRECPLMVRQAHHERTRTGHTRWQFDGSCFDRLRMSAFTITDAGRISPEKVSSRALTVPRRRVTLPCRTVVRTRARLITEQGVGRCRVERRSAATGPYQRVSNASWTSSAPLPMTKAILPASGKLFRAAASPRHPWWTIICAPWSAAATFAAIATCPAVSKSRIGSGAGAIPYRFRSWARSPQASRYSFRKRIAGSRRAMATRLN